MAESAHCTSSNTSTRGARSATARRPASSSSSNLVLVTSSSTGRGAATGPSSRPDAAPLRPTTLLVEPGGQRPQQLAGLGFVELAGQVVEQGHERPVRGGAAVDGHAGPLGHPCAGPAGPGHELVDQPGLADPGLAGEQHGARGAGPGRVERGLEHPHLIGPADERRTRHPLPHPPSVPGPGPGCHGVRARAGRPSPPKRSTTAMPSGAFLDRRDAIGHQAVGLAVHGLGRGRVGRLDQAEHLPGALVEPVLQVVDPVGALHLEVALRGRRPPLPRSGPRRDRAHP